MQPLIDLKMLLIIIKTAFIDEALHRLVELHYKIGLIDESKKYASLLDIIINQVNGIQKVIKYLIKIISQI